MHKSKNKNTHPTAEPAAVQLKDIRKRLPLRVLSPEDWEHWSTSGFVVVPEAVPQANIDRLIQLLWDFQRMDPDDPSTWYKPQLRDHEMKELNNTGMVEVYNHQYLWDNRQEQRVYDTFVDIWDDEALWVTIDRANLNPPNRGGRSIPGFIHWDVDTSLRPFPIGVQGVLSLGEQDREVGGFQCVPELFRTLGEWIEAQPTDRDPWAPDIRGFEIEFVPLKPGDLLVFNSLLAHGIRPNRSDNRVRMAQYISMHPAEEQDEKERQNRITSWRDLEAPKRAAFPGDPRNWEKENSSRARLSSLGARLLGLESWNP